MGKASKAEARMYRVGVRRTTTEYGYAYIEAFSPEGAAAELEENAAQGMIGAFDVQELLEEQHDVDADDVQEVGK